MKSIRENLSLPPFSLSGFLSKTIKYSENSSSTKGRQHLKKIKKSLQKGGYGILERERERMKR